MHPVTVKIQDAVARVRDNLHLADPDASMYVHLCLAGPAKASDIADTLHVHRNDIYRTAERLIARGLVETSVERPARYVAVDPTRVFDKEIGGRLQDLETLRAAREQVMELLIQLRAHAAPPSKGTYRIVQGRREIYELRDELARNAKESIHWATTFNAAIPHAEISGALDLMLARAREGVEFRALVRAPQQHLDKLAPFLQLPNAQARRFEAAGDVRFMIFDQKELLMFVVNDPSESLYAKEEAALFSTAQGFVHAQRVFFEQAWGPSPPIVA